MYAVLHGSPCHYCIGMRRRFFLKRQVRPLLHTYTSLEVHSMYYIAQSEGRSLCNVQCKSKGKTDAAKLSYNKSKDLCKPLHTVGFHDFPYFELKVISTKTVESNSFFRWSASMPFYWNSDFCSFSHQLKENYKRVSVFTPSKISIDREYFATDSSISSINLQI